MVLEVLFLLDPRQRGSDYKAPQEDNMVANTGRIQKIPRPASYKHVHMTRSAVSLYAKKKKKKCIIHAKDCLLWTKKIKFLICGVLNHEMNRFISTNFNTRNDIC